MVVLADNQDITRAGMMHVCDSLGDMPYRQAADKTELIEQLKTQGDAIVVLATTYRKKWRGLMRAEEA